MDKGSLQLHVLGMECSHHYILLTFKSERYRVGYQFNQKLLITIIIEKISTIHKFILKI